MKQLNETRIHSDRNKCCNHALILFKKCANLDKIIDEWYMKNVRDQTWKELKQSIPDEYTKMKLKADECNAKSAGFWYVANVEEVKEPSIKDYAVAAGELSLSPKHPSRSLKSCLYPILTHEADDCTHDNADCWQNHTNSINPYRH